MIDSKLSKKLNFHHTQKSYSYQLESVLEFEMHKIQWITEIQMNQRIQARRPDLVLISKIKTTKTSGFCVFEMDLFSKCVALTKLMLWYPVFFLVFDSTFSR